MLRILRDADKAAVLEALIAFKRKDSTEMRMKTVEGTGTEWSSIKVTFASDQPLSLPEELKRLEAAVAVVATVRGVSVPETRGEQGIMIAIGIIMIETLGGMTKGEDSEVKKRSMRVTWWKDSPPTFLSTSVAKIPFQRFAVKINIPSRDCDR